MAIDVETRKAAVRAVESGLSATAVSRHYGFDKDQIRKWRANPEKYLKSEAERLAEFTGVIKRHIPQAQTDFGLPKPISVSGHSTGHARTAEPFRIGVIPDCQVKPGVDISHLEKIGRYFADKRPNVIVCIGDFADMPSHSFHDEPGSKAFSAQNYKEDILSVHLAMKLLMEPIKAAQGYNPRLVMTLGNHEHRILRTLEKIPKLDGTLGIQDLEYERWGWEVHPFLKPVVIEGVAFCHYFQTGQMGRPASSARAILNKQHMSCFAGHQQGRDIAYGKRGDGREITAIICGSCYLHDEDYLSPQTNNHFRGIYMLNDVQDGQFEEMPVSLRYLMRRYS